MIRLRFLLTPFQARSPLKEARVKHSLSFVREIQKNYRNVSYRTIYTLAHGSI